MRHNWWLISNNQTKWHTYRCWAVSVHVNTLMFNMLNMLLLYSCMLKHKQTDRFYSQVYSDDAYVLPIVVVLHVILPMEAICDLTDGGNDDHSANNEESEPEFTNKCGMLWCFLEPPFNKVPRHSNSELVTRRRCSIWRARQLKLLWLGLLMQILTFWPLNR